MTAPILDYTDRHAVVTGAGQGIGAAIARALAAAGARVAVLDRDPAAAETVTDTILAARGRAYAVACDVTSAADVARAAAEVGRYGAMNVLINNAGAIDRAEIGAADYVARLERLLAVNVAGMARVTSGLLPALKATSGASIVNLASVQSFVALRPGLSAYVASKGAVAQWTRALAAELASDGIRVNAVAPGIIVTPMSEAARSNAEVARNFVSRIPLARYGEAEEVASAVLFLASPLAAYITGTVLPVDGGLLAL